MGRKRACMRGPTPLQERLPGRRLQRYWRNRVCTGLSTALPSRHRSHLVLVLDPLASARDLACSEHLLTSLRTDVSRYGLAPPEAIVVDFRAPRLHEQAADASLTGGWQPLALDASQLARAPAVERAEFVHRLLVQLGRAGPKSDRALWAVRHLQNRLRAARTDADRTRLRRQLLDLQAEAVETGGGLTAGCLLVAADDALLAHLLNFDDAPSRSTGAAVPLAHYGTKFLGVWQPVPVLSLGRAGVLKGQG